ncbi:MAG: pitrilysin family protein [Pirellulaceae bacterium]|nr:pitrilysin family protein [Pirellulaceae bacterium]
MQTQNQQIKSHRLANGMTIVGEIMPWLESAAFSFSVPAGCQFDPEGKEGLANFVCEMVQRGCGKLNSREYIERLEWLGVDYSSSASVYHTHFSGAMPAANLYEAFEVYHDVFRNPIIPESQLEEGRMVCYQEIRSIEDDLAQRVMLQLRKRQYGDPRGRWSQGSMESVASLTQDDVREFFNRYYQPDGLILSVAGNIDWDQLVGRTEALFADWKAVPVGSIEDKGSIVGSLHIPFDSQQSHIAIACPCAAYSDPDYFLARGSIGVLSDGMSSRLFRELREKRGLCYTVFASLHSVLNQACMVAYVGTSSERAQESLDALVEQLLELEKGVEEEELDRLKVQIRSSLVLQQESSRSRAGSIAGDWFHLGRARTLGEVTGLISDLSAEKLNEYVRANPLRNFNLVTLGPEPLELKHGIPSASAG